MTDIDPWTDEELAKAEKYRAQKDGGQEMPLSDDGDKADSYDHIRGDDGKVRVSIRKDSTLGPEHQPEHYTIEQADPAQVIALEREVERIRKELAEVLRFDPRTGEAIPKYTGEHRRAREIRLEHLERTELPVVRAIQAKAAAWRAENVPTALQALSDEKARRDRVKERALGIADEREAQAMADRIQAERRSRG